MFVKVGQWTWGENPEAVPCQYQAILKSDMEAGGDKYVQVRINLGLRRLLV